jgi:hypothetical protein
MIVSASFNDYLYILVGIVWLIFSVYKSQKKKADNAQGSQQKPQKSFLESLIDEFNPETKVAPIPYDQNDEPFDSSENKQEYVTEIFSYDDAVEESNETETSVVYRQKEVEKAKTDTVKDSKVIDNQKNSRGRAFSLKNAVINAEILNPKYF